MITDKDLQLQHEFCRQICINFKQWCKDNGTNLSRELNVCGRVNRSTIACIISGKKQYIPNIAIAYIASKTNLSIAELANYHNKIACCEILTKQNDDAKIE